MTPDPLPWQDLAMRLGAALLAGLLLGLDRESKQRPAGMRTMMLVCLGCAAATAAGYQVAARLGSGSDSMAAESLSRVLQGILGGIGFLGAGAVLHRESGVKGLTTAAAIWVTAAIGIACGLGEYALAVIATAAALFILAALKPVENTLFPSQNNNNDDPKDTHSD